MEALQRLANQLAFSRICLSYCARLSPCSRATLMMAPVRAGKATMFG